MNLHSDKEAFKEIIALAAEHFGYEQSHVEKDYWVSKIPVKLISNYLIGGNVLHCFTESRNFFRCGCQYSDIVIFLKIGRAHNDATIFGV